MCAKTGTAQVVEASMGKNTYSRWKGRARPRLVCWFRPEKQPVRGLVVMVEYGGHGGDVGQESPRRAWSTSSWARSLGGGWTSRARSFPGPAPAAPEVPTDLPPRAASPEDHSPSPKACLPGGRGNRVPRGRTVKDAIKDFWVDGDHLTTLLFLGCSWRDR